MNQNQLIDRLINLETDDYYENHHDLQQAVNGMSEIDRKLWLLNHFIKHGYAEGRKYKLTRGMAIDETQPNQPIHRSRHDHKKKSKDEKKAKQDKASDTEETDVQQLIQKFRHKYSHTKGGKRDKDGDKVAPPVAGRNVFWEISR